MFPDGSMSSKAMVADYLIPDQYNRATNRLIDYEKGGIALSDPSHGSNYQIWRLEYSVSTGDFTLYDEAENAFVVLTIANVTEVALTFDQNMRPCIAYVALGVTNLYWYDPLQHAMINQVFEGVRSPALGLDIKLIEFVTISDIMFVYLRGNTLCYRRQRDRYGVEYEIREFSGDSVDLLQVGMTHNNRFQFRVKVAS